MKKHIFTLLFLLFSIFSIAQTERIAKPVAQNTFEAYMENIQMIKSPAGKVEKAMYLANNMHFTCRQIQEISFILPDDKIRLQFSLKAYEKAINPKDYYVIMDSFQQYSSAFKFYDAKHNLIKPETINSEENIHQELKPVKPQIIVKFPSAEGYTGATHSNCKSPISSSEFKQLGAKMNAETNPQEKLNKGLQIAEKYCLSVEQLMKLGILIEDENTRYKLFSGAYDYIFDVAHFRSVIQLLKTDYYKNKIMHLTEPPLTEKPSPVNKTDLLDNKLTNTSQINKNDINEHEINEIVSTLKGESFESTRISTAKQIIKTKKRFKTEQIIQMLKTFDYESTKLDMAKFAFPYVTDKANYYNISRIFEFSSNKEELQEFIEMQ